MTARKKDEQIVIIGCAEGQKARSQVATVRVSTSNASDRVWSTRTNQWMTRSEKLEEDRVAFCAYDEMRWHKHSIVPPEWW